MIPEVRGASQRNPLLSNSLLKLVSMAKNMHTIVEELLGAVCSNLISQCQGYIKRASEAQIVDARLPEMRDRKIWSRVPQNPDPRMTVTARPSSNLPDRPKWEPSSTETLERIPVTGGHNQATADWKDMEHSAVVCRL
jgi:hypothetical protein